ncbi:MAG TPA: c-type cytochrome [Burkholderiaceae bacterium]|nr:c-type cytochrome [Burkholderiaceae bacterium]
MNRVFRWIGIIVAVLVVVGVGLVLAANLLFERKRERVVNVDVKPVTVVADAAALDRGKYLFMSRGCGDCHAANGAGRAFIDEPGGGFYVRSPNITPGGVVAKYTELDWVRSIRHGVNPQGRALFVMPSEDYNRFTDRDVAAIVAYARSLPAVAGGGAELRVPLPVKALYAIGIVKDAAEKIDHSLPPALPVAEGETSEHGRYVANLCIGCHGEGLSGGKIPGGPPDWPAASNLTPGPGTVMLAYDSVDKLKSMFRSGKRPGGTAVAVMPFATLREINDTDVAALYAYLKQLPPRPAGGR